MTAGVVIAGSVQAGGMENRGFGVARLAMRMIPVVAQDGAALVAIAVTARGLRKK